MSIKKTVLENGIGIDFDGENTVAYSLDGLSPEIVHRLAIHGLSQKVGDSYSGHNGIADAIAKANEVYDALSNGDWNNGRTGGGGDLIEAVMRVTKQPRDAVSDKIADMSKDERKALRKNVQVKAALDAIKAERAAQRAKDDSGEDLEALFN